MAVVDGEKAARMIKSTVIWEWGSGCVSGVAELGREEARLTIGLHRMPAKRVPAASSTAAGCEQTATIGELADLSHLGFKLEVKTHEDDSQESSPALQEERRGSA
jgi:hypothetical protein